MEHPMLRKMLNRLMRPYIVMRERHLESRLGLLSEEERFALIYRTGYWTGEAKGSLLAKASA
jgi:hypothetical protein